MMVKRLSHLSFLSGLNSKEIFRPFLFRKKDKKYSYSFFQVDKYGEPPMFFRTHVNVL